jgi:hypothetical protein
VFNHVFTIDIVKSAGLGGKRLFYVKKDHLFRPRLEVGIQPPIENVGGGPDVQLRYFVRFKIGFDEVRAKKVPVDPVCPESDDLWKILKEPFETFCR